MDQRALVWRGGVLGIGLGGAFDGIVLHQLLQWHHLASSIVPTDTVEGLEVNTFWDGVFHSAMYAVMIVGLILLWRALSRPGVRFDARLICSAIAIGFGSFHVIDSLLFHWTLNLHHICYGPTLVACDVGYFLIGLLLIGAGGIGLRSRRAQPTPG